MSKDHSSVTYQDTQILSNTRAHRRAESKPLDEAGDIGQFTERDLCQTGTASDVISGKGKKGD